jgi:integrase
MPKKRLTSAFINSAPNPPSGTVDYYDELLPGLAFRCSYKGGRSWTLKYLSPVSFDNRGNRKQRRIMVGKSPRMKLAEAREKAREILREVDSGIDPQREKMKAKEENALKLSPDPRTIEEGYCRYVDDHVKLNNKPRVREDGSEWWEREWIAEKYIFPAIGDLLLSEVTRKDVMNMRRKIEKLSGPVMADRAAEAVRTAFNWLHDNEIADAPIIRVKSTTKNNARHRVLSVAELVMVKDETDRMSNSPTGSTFAAVVQVLILTGQRRREVSDMRWSELDLDSLTWNLPPERTKNGLPHSVPLSPPVIKIIEVQRDRQSETDDFADCDFVFSTNGRSPYSGFSRSKQRMDNRLEIEHWVLHDLRRTFVTRLNEIGIPPHVVEACVNHISGASRVGVAGVYNRAQYWPERVDALNRWAETLERIVSGDTNVVQLHSEGT